MFCENCITFGEYIIDVESGELEFLQHNCLETCRPLIFPEAVKALLEQSSRVIQRNDLKDSKHEHFKTVSDVVNKSS